jgi:ABC-type multidrug transport system ATPase subunit
LIAIICSRLPPPPQACIHAACLEPDIAILQNGDQTEIGERGLTLSGGQKQRVSLARALYSNKEMYLLDDPLSAVDAEVGRSIFDRYIRGMLKGKTVLFVTHQLQYLPQCDRILYIEQGKVAESGTHASLLEAHGGYEHLFASHSQNQDTLHEKTSAESQPSAAIKSGVRQVAVATEDAADGTAENAAAGAATGPAALSSKLSQGQTDNADVATTSKPTTATEESATTENNKLVAQEELLTGSVTIRTYLQYCKAAGGVVPISLLILLFIMAAAAKVFSDVFLTEWLEIASRRYNAILSEDPYVHLYALIYGLSAVGVLLIQAVRALFYTNRTLTAASSLHARVGSRQGTGNELRDDGLHSRLLRGSMSTPVALVLVCINLHHFRLRPIIPLLNSSTPRL